MLHQYKQGFPEKRFKDFDIEQESEDACQDNKRDDTRYYEQDLFLMENHVSAPLALTSKAVRASS